MKGFARPLLRRQLTLRLMLPLVLIVAVAGAIGLFGAQAETAEVFDRWLLDSANSLANQVRGPRDDGSGGFDLPTAARAILGYDEVDHVWYAVQDRDRVWLGTAGLPVAGRHETRYAGGRAFDAVYAGQPVRVAMANAGCSGCEHVVVLVAETTLKRQRANRVVQWLLAPLGLMLLVTCSAILAAARRTVRPLEALAEQWNRQSHASLAPIPEGDLPRELLPFATALNDLLSRLRGMLLRERTFAAAAAHQLRTPLAGLRLGLARARAAGDLAATHAVLDELAGVTEHTGRLVQQLLLLGRLDPETRLDVGADVDLRDVAQDVAGLFAEMALDSGLDLELQVPDAPVVVRGHADLLVEAAANLFDNATKAAGRRGRVLASVRDDPPRLCVCDSGPGILPTERQAIFERYVRGSSATWAGTGLGLAIVRDIARLHGAEVEVDDSELGGACLTLAFGAAAAPNA
jgi:two-component system, OmpR family, sensor histidine kinase TctE